MSFSLSKSRGTSGRDLIFNVYLTGCRKVWKFQDRLNYKQKPRRGRCLSFDFSDADVSDTFDYKERLDDGSIMEVDGVIK